MLPATAHVRPAIADDIPALVQLCSRVQKMHRTERPSLFREPDTALLTGYFSDQIATEGTYVLATTDDVGAVVGYALAAIVDVAANPFTVDGRRLDLFQIAVAQDHEGRGHGSALLHAVGGLARELAIDSVVLTVWTFNERAASLFTRAGFVAMSQRMRLDTSSNSLLHQSD